MRSLIQIYVLAVCFATLMCFIVALGIGLYDVVQFAAPSFTLQYYELYESNEAYLQYHPNKKELSDNEISKLREQMHRAAIHGERRAALQSAVFVLIIVCIDIVVFALHWRIAKSERDSTAHPIAT